MSEEQQKRYQCGKTGSKTSVFKVLDGMTVKCSGGSWIVNPGSKCRIECDTGGPNYKEIECKPAGWRPTNEIQCEGVNPGVIVGVLIAGLAGVVILAIGYAKYRQHMKAKSGKSVKVQSGKINVNPARRPGKVVVGPPTAEDKPPPRPHIGSESSSTRNKDSWKNESKKSKQLSYTDMESGIEVNTVSSKSIPESRAPPDIPPHDRRGRRSHRKAYPDPQYGYDSGFQGYQYDDASAQQVGYDNHGYYHGQPEYGYPAQHEPAVGYGALSHPPAYAPSRGYH